MDETLLSNLPYNSDYGYRSVFVAYLYKSQMAIEISRGNCKIVGRVFDFLIEILTLVYCRKYQICRKKLASKLEVKAPDLLISSLTCSSGGNSCSTSERPARPAVQVSRAGQEPAKGAQ